jgi:hypothetical protein
MANSRELPLQAGHAIGQLSVELLELAREAIEIFRAGSGGQPADWSDWPGRYLPRHPEHPQWSAHIQGSW